jgi:hypothetical protein
VRRIDAPAPAPDGGDEDEQADGSISSVEPHVQRAPVSEKLPSLYPVSHSRAI